MGYYRPVKGCLKHSLRTRLETGLESPNLLQVKAPRPRSADRGACPEHDGAMS